MNQTPRILMIDDDEMSVLILARILQREGFIVLSAKDGPNGRTIASKEVPDLILLDLNMPGENGLVTCEKLKKDPVTSDIPILFLSADSDVDTKVACFKAGGMDYIGKPFESIEVLARVRNHLSLHQALKDRCRLQCAQLAELAGAQRSILPPPPDEMPDAHFASIYKPLSNAGGDFYDVLKIGEGVYDYITADVCGHDTGISFVTAALKIILAQNCSSLHSPLMTLSLINKLIKVVLKPGQHISIAWVRINRKIGKALIVNGGQPPVIIFPSNSEPRVLKQSGDIIGVFEHVIFESIEIKVNSGDRILLYSDGLVERDGTSPADREKGIGDLIEICRDRKAETLQRLFDDIVPRIFGNKPILDDIVVLGIEI